MPIASDFHRAAEQWPFIGHIEEEFGLPHNMLFAVGSRETGLHNIVGDHGHGHGVWQLDDRSHHIPPGFDNDPEAQARTAAEMLHQLHHRFGDWEQALNAYNSGHPDAAHTTGHNYGPDVLHRLHQIDEIEQADHAAPHDGGHTAPHDSHAAPGHTAPHDAQHGQTGPHAHPGHPVPHDHGHAAPGPAAPGPAAPPDAGAPPGGGHGPVHDPSLPVAFGYGTVPSQAGASHAVNYDPSHAGSSTALHGDANGPQDGAGGHAVAYDPGHASSDPGHTTAYDPSHATAYDPSHATGHASYDASTASPHDQGHDGSTGSAGAGTASDPNQALADQAHHAAQAGSSGGTGDSPHAAEIAQHASGNEVA